MDTARDQSIRIAELERQLEVMRVELAAARSEAPLLGALLRDIGERKRVEARLSESQEWLHLAQEAAGVAAYSYDYASGTLRWSPSAYSLYGLDPARTPSVELWLSVVHPDDREAVERVARRTIERGSNVDHEYRVMLPDGSVRWVRDRAQVSLGMDGRPARLAGLNIDISDQRTAHDELRDRDERLRAALAGSGAGTFRWDIATNALDWDAGLDRLFGLAPGATARSLKEFIARVHPDDRARVHAACERCAREGADFEETFRVVLPDGTLRWIYDRGRTYCRDDGQPSYMTGACLDVSHRANAARRLATVLEGVSDGFMAIDQQWRITLLNAAAERYFGLSRSDVVGRPFWDVYADHKGTRFEAVFREVMDGRKSATFDVASIRRPGRTAELKVSPTADGGIAIGFSDVTERKVAETALAESANDLSFALKAGRLGAWTLDLASGEMTTSELCRTNFGRDPALDFPYPELLDAVHPDDRARMRGAVEESLSTGADYDIEYRVITPGGETRWLSVSGRPVHENGVTVRMTGVSLDVTQRKVEEEHRALLLGELSHRVKNMLGLVQAAAHLTLGGRVPEDVQRDFAGRLAALAGAQDVLTKQSWTTVRLRDLLDRTLVPFAAPAEGRIEFDGPELRLQAKTAVTFALAVHELATNAVKYGALSAPGGVVEIGWWLVRTEAGARLKLRWQERNGPPVSMPSRRGFGSRMIERALAAELRGTVKIEFAAAGVRCSIDAPLPYLDQPRAILEAPLAQQPAMSGTEHKRHG